MRDNGHHARSFQNNPHLVASYSLAMKGVQKVNVTDNNFVNNAVDYELLAGIRTTRLDNFVNVYRNYWGTPDVEQINEKIFDFDDWNSYAIARFRPYFLEDLDTFRDGAQSSLSDRIEPMNVDHLGGRLFHDLVLPPRPKPYVVHTDLTVMPGITLTILPGVDLQFYPSVGILVLGFLHAEGHWESPIRMYPAPRNAAINYRVVRSFIDQPVSLKFFVQNQNVASLFFSLTDGPPVSRRRMSGRQQPRIPGSVQQDDESVGSDLRQPLH